MCIKFGNHSRRPMLRLQIPHIVGLCKKHQGHFYHWRSVLWSLWNNFLPKGFRHPDHISESSQLKVILERYEAVLSGHGFRNLRTFRIKKERLDCTSPYYLISFPIQDHLRVLNRRLGVSEAVQNEQNHVQTQAYAISHAQIVQIVVEVISVK